MFAKMIVVLFSVSVRCLFVCPQYVSEAAMVADLELMFNNARHYNEENSQVYKDAQSLEKVLLSKLRSLPPLDPSTPLGKNL